MRLIVAASIVLFVGFTYANPIEQVETTTTLPEGRSDILQDATTQTVEIVSEDVAVTQRARQAPGEEEDEDSNEEVEATTLSATRNRPPPAIPQPFANISNFLAEFQYSSQFELGPKDAPVPVPGQAASAAAPVAPVPQVAPVASSPPVVPGAPVTAPVAQTAGNPGAAPAAVVPAAAPAAIVPAVAPAAVVPPVIPSVPQRPEPISVVIAGEDEDENDSDEVTNAPVAVSDLSQSKSTGSASRAQAPVQKIVEEESDSDNEITNDDVTTVKSFISEYEYTIQQLNTPKGSASP